MSALLYQLDAMSRRLVAGMLEERHFAYAFTLDREEALAAVQGGAVDLVFADTQKDGLEFVRATRATRRRAQTRIHVIALMLADTPGNRRQCQEAGADIVLPIPVRMPDVVAVVDQLMFGKISLNTQDSPQKQNHRPALDFIAALERVEGDRELLDELLRLFIDECHSSLRQIRDSWTSRDAQTLGRLAHTLKGSSANVGANGVSEAAFVLEKVGRTGSLENAVQHIATLEREIERLEPELDSFLRQTAR